VSGRVRIGTCANPADAAFVRSMFAARGIAVVIAAEHHASLLGAIGSGFLSLDIWVAAEDAEDAAALLRDLRESDAGDAAADAAGAPDGDPADACDDGDDFDVQAYTERRRRTGLAILLACFVTFGTGHMVTGAWLRGVLLAAIETLGIRLLVHGNRIGSALIVATVAADLIGALWRLRAASPPPLPVARIRRG
jgi:Putative prokaryotic signal transducing protein